MSTQRIIKILCSSCNQKQFVNQARIHVKCIACGFEMTYKNYERVGCTKKALNDFDRSHKVLDLMKNTELFICYSKSYKQFMVTDIVMYARLKTSHELEKVYHQK